MAAIDDLHNLITKLETSLLIKPSNARSLTSGLIDTQITRLNAATSTVEKDRLKILEAESKILQKNNVFHRSNTLFRGYEVMRRYPNHFSSASQAADWDRAMLHFINPNRSRLLDLTEKHGSYGGSRVFKQANFSSYYKDLSKIGKDEWDLRREELFEKYGGTVDPDAGRRADDVISKERAEKAKSLRRSRRLRSLSAERAYKFDLMDEYDQEISTLKEKYGGGAIGRRRAEEVWQRGVFKEFRWLKPIARNIPLIGKNLPAISKALHTAARTPGIGGLVRHPIVAGAGAVGLVANYYLGKMQRNAQLGAISDVLGMPLSRLRSAGHVLSAWGGSEKDLASAMSSFGTAQGKMFMGLGGTEHLEQLAMAGIDIRGSGKGGLLTMNEKIQRVSEAIRKAYASGDQDKVLALASIGGFSSAMTEAAIRGEDLSQYEGLFGLTATESGRRRGEAANRRKNSFWTEMLSYVFGNYTGGSSVGAMNFGSTQTGASTQAVASTQASRKHRYLIKTNGVEREMTPEEIKDFEERKAEWKEEADQKRAEHWARIEKSEAYKKAMSAYVQGDSAAVSASQYLANGNGGVNGNITVQIGTLQTDAKNYKDLMTDIATVGITDPSTRKAIIDSFDTLGE